LIVVQAPEQFNGRLSEASDVYSLGMILWECWCSKRPWGTSGDDMEIWQVMYRLIHENERPEIPDNCPSALKAVINDCWHTDPKERPTALDVKNRLWRIILAEMKKLNGGPQRVPSPKRVVKQEVKAQVASTEKPGSPLRPKDVDTDSTQPSQDSQASNSPSRFGEPSAPAVVPEKGE
jgi:serine/threonine protein kinase